jgi:hypothetical protein
MLSKTTSEVILAPRPVWTDKYRHFKRVLIVPGERTRQNKRNALHWHIKFKGGYKYVTASDDTVTSAAAPLLFRALGKPGNGNEIHKSTEYRGRHQST